MSRAQGDGFKTWTDESLNAYRRNLDKKLRELIDEKEKVYTFGQFCIYTSCMNVIDNPRGSWKWDGWQIIGRRYTVEIYLKSAIECNEGKIKVSAPALVKEDFDNKDQANARFIEFRDYLKKVDKED